MTGLTGHPIVGVRVYPLFQRTKLIDLWSRDTLSGSKMSNPSGSRLLQYQVFRRPGCTMAPSASSSTRPRPDQKSKKRRGLASSPIVDSIKPKTKRTRLTVDTLRWQPVKATGFSGMDEGGGMMMLEELDDVLVEWDEDESGRKVARFVVSFGVLVIFGFMGD